MICTPLTCKSSQLVGDQVVGRTSAPARVCAVRAAATARSWASDCSAPAVTVVFDHFAGLLRLFDHNV